MHEKFSKIGFVLAMAGSAVGLGNAWKFPTMVGNHGGSAFILLYPAFQPLPGSIMRKNSASSITGTPSVFALVSLLPAASPAST